MTTGNKVNAKSTKSDDKGLFIGENDEADNVQRGFPVVGMGASAGGLAAFEAFFSAMPVDEFPGMAFVVVQHLAPDHKSMLTELIQRCTAMQVLEVEDGMVVQPNCVYIIPPGRDLAFLNGALQLLEPSAPRGHRYPIDFFFRSMAQDQHERAIGVVLSGTGSDGTMGVRAIKDEGGMVMVQSIDSSEYDGMPNSAIATGLVDYQLPPAEMPANLIAYVAHAFGKIPRAVSISELNEDNILKKIFILLRSHTGHDFSQYKPSSINRRIERRMAVHQIDTMEAYVKYLLQTPVEVDALFRDLLIGVTRFFRDAEAFRAFEEKVITRLIANKAPGAQVRVWVPGCSTGEEAYSIAILLQEQLEQLKNSYTVQVFATDIDSQAISKARSGVYPASIVDDISPERLIRYFTAESDGGMYRIRKNIREMVVFSIQNVIKDPPFSKLDLISCRNLMIYMSGDLQKKLIPLFHYALNPKGMLFLGTSETVGEFHSLFVTLDSKSKLYQRRESSQESGRTGLTQLLPLLTVKDSVRPPAAEKSTIIEKIPLRELTERELLKQVGAVAVLVNNRGDILYLHGKTGLYLEPPLGEVGVINILTMAREGLKQELYMALHHASGKKEIVTRHGLWVKTNGHYITVNLTVCPVETGFVSQQEPYLYLVVMEENQEHRTIDREIIEEPGYGNPDSDARIEALKQELLTKDEYFQAAKEELETSNEELKSSNEEMQSLNEELQSTNEELETSKEELQSVNEELTTVNGELQSKLIDLAHANNDMNNLLAGTGIATVFVDHDLCILRYTPSATHITNLIQSDIGRPVGHILSNLVGYTDLPADVKSVLDTLMPKAIEVETTEGLWYTLRIQPYRTLDNVIEGAVISFVDITEIVNTKKSLQKANELLRLAVVVLDSNDAITMQDMEGRILVWNPGAARLYGWSEAEALEMNTRDRIPESLRSKETERLHHLAISNVLEPYPTQRIAKDGSIVDVVLTVTALVNDAGQMYAISTTERMKS